MRAQRFLFVTMLYLVAAATLVTFVSNAVPWFQFRFSSQPATLSLQPTRVINGPEDELKLLAEQRTLGHAVQLKLASGATIASHAHLTTEQYSQASKDQGLGVLFRKDGRDKVKVIGDLRELDSPWLWLMLFFAFALTARYARRLHAQER